MPDRIILGQTRSGRKDIVVLHEIPVTLLVTIGSTSKHPVVAEMDTLPPYVREVISNPERNDIENGRTAIIHRSIPVSPTMTEPEMVAAAQGIYTQVVSQFAGDYEYRFKSLGDDVPIT